MGEYITLIFSCDKYKSRQSMRLIMATTDEETAIDFIYNKIKIGDMFYFDDLLEYEEQAERFLADYRKGEDLNRDLFYGYIDYYKDGEEY